ncbi:sensor histidine kinase [Cohnella abietis]|uniref:histidine kinase n=1 Tax=Cohnella abietis TaxID=2507935 RepID=A0A3T1D6P7_9BACL|nr:HAMP domain-containing sensor histidine kinase [Cohnella abietis]BBI33756.1 two-component sensor histidine kinase [Cohnella abietis]
MSSRQERREKIKQNGHKKKFNLRDRWRENKAHRTHMRELGRQLRPSTKWIFLGIFSIHALIAIGWASAYYVMGLISRTWFPEYGHTIIRQYLTVILALTFIFILINLIRVFIAPVRRQMDWFLQMINAMKQLAKGNFDVNLETNTPFLGQFGPLVLSFNEMASELSQMEKMRQEFISNVSHEIQSPLTSITGFARALQNEDLPLHTRKHYLEIIETESKRLSRMSDNLLKLTSLETKHHPFELKPFRLDRQLRHIILACEPLWQEKNIEMDVDLPEISVLADEDLMNQVWVNLLHNSIKFTPDNGIISLHIAKQERHIRIEIADSGIGVSDKALLHLFERFYKEDQSRERLNSGSGLGLSIVKKIIEMHGGEVTARNKAGAGTGAVFTVLLPISGANN